VIVVRIYTTTYCGYCDAAKSLLEKKGVAFEEIDCTSDPATRRWLVERTGRRTVPQIFIRDQAIGGYDELRALDRAGKLDPMLQAEPAPG
jgi:glutaredoxin 3